MQIRTLLALGLLSQIFFSCPEDPKVDPDAPLATFPEDFVFGTAIAQWQVCGDRSVDGTRDIQSNWSAYLGQGNGAGEQTNGEGNGFCTLYEEDIARAKDLGLDMFRLSIDWARVHPSPDTFDAVELDHFEGVLDAIVENDMEPVLTLWHWVMPLFIANTDDELGDGAAELLVEDPELALEYWRAFVTEVVDRVKDRVDVYTTLNEPFSMISAGYLAGEFPPGSFLQIERGTQFSITLMRMHAVAYDIIKERDDVDADGDGVTSFVGFTQTATPFYPTDPDNFSEKVGVESQSYVANDWFMNALVHGNLDVNLDGDSDDLDQNPPEGFREDLAGRVEFIGVQYYGPVRVQQNLIASELHPLYGLPVYEVDGFDETLPHNGMKREIYAAGLKRVLDIYAAYDIPMWLTENGTTRNRPPADEDTLESEDDEAHAAMFIAEHLTEAGRAIAEGYDVQAYFHWTIADNFEWIEGERQRFGAFHVDFDSDEKTRTRTLVADVLQDIASSHEVSQETFKKYVLDKYSSDQRDDAGLTLTDEVPDYILAPRVLSGLEED